LKIPRFCNLFAVSLVYRLDWAFLVLPCPAKINAVFLNFIHLSYPSGIQNRNLKEN